MEIPRPRISPAAVWAFVAVTSFAAFGWGAANGGSEELCNNGTTPSNSLLGNNEWVDCYAVNPATRNVMQIGAGAFAGNFVVGLGCVMINELEAEALSSQY